MTLSITSLRDNISGEYGHVVGARTIKSALRLYASVLASNPDKDEFSVYLLGTIDTDTGAVSSITPEEIPSNLGETDETVQ